MIIDTDWKEEINLFANFVPENTTLSSFLRSWKTPILLNDLLAEYAHTYAWSNWAEQIYREYLREEWPEEDEEASVRALAKKLNPFLREETLPPGDLWINGPTGGVDHVVMGRDWEETSVRIRVQDPHTYWNIKIDRGTCRYKIIRYTPRGEKVVLDKTYLTKEEALSSIGERIT